jgi:hypothetical protein
VIPLALAFHRSLISEVEQNLAATQSLLERYANDHVASSSNRSELEDELRGTLSLLEADLEDLDESVRIVESKGDRWGLGEDEVRKRRGFVQRVKRDVEGLRRKVLDKAGAKRDKGKGKEREPYRDLPDAEAGTLDDGDPEEQKRWEMEEQQVGRDDADKGARSTHTRLSCEGRTTRWVSSRAHCPH